MSKIDSVEQCRGCLFKHNLCGTPIPHLMQVYALVVCICSRACQTDKYFNAFLLQVDEFIRVLYFEMLRMSKKNASVC